MLDQWLIIRVSSLQGERRLVSVSVSVTEMGSVLVPINRNLVVQSRTLQRAEGLTPVHRWYQQTGPPADIHLARVSL